MGKSVLYKKLKVEGMTCAGCEMRIENKLKKLPGIIDCKVSYINASVLITYEPAKIEISKIIDAIESLDYKVKRNLESKIAASESEAKKNGKMPVNQLIGIGIILLAGYLIISNTIGFNFIPPITQNMGYGVLFVIGLITSLHCIAMCGGINLSQCVSYKFEEKNTKKLAKMKPSLMYNAGRVISYTLIGGIVGALGSVISFSGAAKGAVAIISGLFMIVMGLNMLNIFPWLRKFNPRIPKIFGNRVLNNNGKHGPFYVGLLNGLMPCGPLQAMQIYALGTGSFLAGAGSMLFFSLGTVPLMFGFGAISSFLSSKFTHRMLKVSAVLVMILGVIMLTRGFNLSGFNFANDITYAASASGNVAKVEGAVQTVSTKLESGKYTPFTVQKGVPVKWTLHANANDINGCNETVTIPKYGISKKLVAGDNLIEFTPDEDGNIPYTCWMGMISSNIKVVSDISLASKDELAAGSSAGPNGSTKTGSSAGGCCGVTPPGFVGGKILTDKIGIAKIINGQQEVTITVDNQGYSPAVVVLQKGVKTIIKFKTDQLTGCNSTVIFPEIQGQLDLNTQKETPVLIPEKDFTFQCGMAMLHGYVKVVDDINKVDVNAIKKEIKNNKPAVAPGGASGCCG